MTTFENAQKRLEKALQHLEISEDALDILSQPKEALQGRLSIRMDDGSLKSFTGYRVRYNDHR